MRRDSIIKKLSLYTPLCYNILYVYNTFRNVTAADTYYVNYNRKTEQAYYHEQYPITSFACVLGRIAVRRET